MSFQVHSPKSQPCTCCCLETLYTILDSENVVEITPQLMSKIEKCLPCYQEHDLEKSIKELLQSHLQRITPPQALLDTIRAKIAQINQTFH
ncbi:MAG: anti-sigma factor [Raineya sp.]|nr:anti-sigma factor [Raineya sp.]MDW8295899.1 anti-sigma factor [Raineya sp.]